MSVVPGTTRRLRVGRMARWQRRSIYVVLAACAITGIVWFAMTDWLALPPSRTRFWWIAHGVTAVPAGILIGSALSQHVVVAWRAARGRIAGSLSLAVLALLIGTALYLMYGPEAGHDALHWIHSVGGLAAVGTFTFHVLWGRSRPGRMPVDPKAGSPAGSDEPREPQ